MDMSKHEELATEVANVVLPILTALHMSRLPMSSMNSVKERVHEDTATICLLIVLGVIKLTGNEVDTADLEDELGRN